MDAPGNYRAWCDCGQRSPAHGEPILTMEAGKVPGGLILGTVSAGTKSEIEPLWRASQLDAVVVLLEDPEAR